MVCCRSGTRSVPRPGGRTVSLESNGGSPERTGGTVRTGQETCRELDFNVYLTDGRLLRQGAPVVGTDRVGGQ